MLYLDRMPELPSNECQVHAWHEAHRGIGVSAVVLKVRAKKKQPDDFEGQI
ncbi:hypothetical protein [Pseudomonas sp. NUPR-001]|uniref:hypothetical protein n=1 Tax=Pseudomonas sp. NUPR-001 TaxID=3416058 RepID=UPI003F9E6991